MNDGKTAPEADSGGFGSPRGAFLAGLRQVLGVPAVILAGSFLGFGALVNQAGFELWHGLFSTATGWALPGQVALIELYSVGASLAVIAGAVALVNARLMPMAITLVPLIRDPRYPAWLYYVVAHFIAVTAWALAQRDCPKMPREQRLPYFTAMGLLLWSATLVTTGVGYLLADSVPAYVTLGLVFVNPIYFMLIFAADVKARGRVIALALGALTGPPLYLLTPDWSLPICGLIAGTAAFVIEKRIRRREEAARG